MERTRAAGRAWERARARRGEEVGSEQSVGAAGSRAASPGAGLGRVGPALSALPVARRCGAEPW